MNTLQLQASALEPVAVAVRHAAGASAQHEWAVQHDAPAPITAAAKKAARHARSNALTLAAQAGLAHYSIAGGGWLAGVPMDEEEALATVASTLASLPVVA